MSRLSNALPSDELSPELRAAVDAYADQGGLLGAFTYFFASLETDDEDLAAALASIPTDLFVTSALHDDAIDEVDAWETDRKRRLNEHVSAGDLVFANVLETVADAPPAVDLTPALETVSEIGAGQLAEEEFDATTATVDDAIERVEERGCVWGELVADLAAATGGYSDAQLESIRTIATNELFVLTVIDDLADLPADVENGVATLPLVCFDGDPDEYRTTEALIDDVLTSDVPDRLEDLVTRRHGDIDDAAAALYASLDRSDEEILGAAARALTWYCESVCSVSITETVSPAERRAIRDGLTGDGVSTSQYIAARIEGTDFPATVDTGAESIDVDADADGVDIDVGGVASTVADLPDEPVVRTAIRLRHIESVVDRAMHTSVDDALASLRTASTPPS